MRIGGQTSLLGFDHGMADLTEPIFRQPMSSLGITVGDDVWIGSHVVVLDGVRIGSHAVVGAGSVVTRDVPEWAVVVGNPARVVRDRRTVRARCSDTLRAFADRASRRRSRTCSRGTGTARTGPTPRAGLRTVRAHCDATRTCCSARPTWSRERTWPGCTAGIRRTLVDGHGPDARSRASGHTDVYHLLCVGYCSDQAALHPTLVPPLWPRVEDLDSGTSGRHRDALGTG